MINLSTTTLFISILLLSGLPRTFATVYEVNSTAATNTGTGTSGTLLYCINQANNSTGPHTINFSVAGTISPNSALPALNEAITIDGTTAPGYSGTPVMVLDGYSACGAHGIEISAAGCTIFGLQISGFHYNGILISGNTSDYFQIGAAGKGNIIINNEYRGIEIDKADHATIAYNRLRVDAAGECDGNGYDRIHLINSSHNDSTYSNHVSCNGYNGIQVGG